MTVELVTVANVEILKTGTFKLSSGEHTFTKAQLAAAVANVTEGAQPRLGIGHVDKRFDGTPSIGQVKNLRLSEDGEKIVGDYTNVPKWLAAALPSAYPGRSIEGSCEGDDLKITAVKLLGTTMPGVSSLKDVQQMFSYEGPVMVAAGEDADGRDTTIIIDVTGQGPASVEASSETNEQKESTMDPLKLRKLLGLADDASDEDVTAAMDEELAAQEAEEQEDPPKEGEEQESPKEGEEEESEEEPQARLPVAAADGTVKLDKETYERLLAGASAGVDAREEQLKTERQQLVASAIDEGKIPPARKDHWIKQLEVDPDGAKSILASLQPGLIPVTERGANNHQEQQQEATTGTGLLPELNTQKEG